MKRLYRTVALGSIAIKVCLSAGHEINGTLQRVTFPVDGHMINGMLI